MDITLLEIATDTKFQQPKKASKPIEVTVFGIVIAVSPVDQKPNSLIAVMLLGNVIIWSF